MMSRASPNSQCGFGSNEKSGGEPIVLTTMLWSSSSPTGTSSSGMFGTSRRRASYSPTTSRRSPSSCLMREPTSRISAISSGGFSFDLPSAPLTSFRRARRASVSAMISRRRTSNSMIRSMLPVRPRSAMDFLTRSVSLRIVSMLSISGVPLCVSGLCE